MNSPIFNRAALRAGMILGRRGTAPISYAIMLRTAGLRATLDGTAWSHDGMLIAHNGRWYVGDAEMGHKARLVPLEDWEAAMRRGECKAIVLWPRGVSEEQGQAAAWWWQTHAYGAEYDKLAIKQLAWRWAAEAFGNKLGEEDKFYCTESCHCAYSAVLSPPGSPWWPKNLNPTPGTTRKRTLQGRLRVVAGAFTEYGKQFSIPLDA